MRSPLPRLFAVALSPSAAQAMGTAAEGLSFECADPLFRAHWHSTQGQNDAGQLSSTPVAHTDLVRCRMWNYNPSCCSAPMEAPQQLAFESRRAQLERKVTALKTYLQKLTQLRKSEVYVRSEPSEQTLLVKTIDAIEPTLRAAETCARAVMAFVAGMICFGCNPSWNEFVWRDSSGDVSAVNIDGEACISVDKSCSALGNAGRRLMERVMASTLAKAPDSPLPDLSMFMDRETLCAWLRGTLAMQPLRSVIVGTKPSLEGTSQVHGVGKAGGGTPMGQPTSDTLLPTAPPYSTKPTAALNPVRDGEQGGFDLDAAAAVVSHAPVASSGRRLQHYDINTGRDRDAAWSGTSNADEVVFL